MGRLYAIPDPATPLLPSLPVLGLIKRLKDLAHVRVWHESVEVDCIEALDLGVGQPPPVHVAAPDRDPLLYRVDHGLFEHSTRGLNTLQARVSRVLVLDEPRNCSTRCWRM